MDMLIVVLTFAAGFLVVYGANLLLTDLFLGDKEERRRRLEEEALIRHRKEARESPLVVNPDLSQMAAQALDETSEEKGLGDRLQEMIDQAGMRTSAEKVLVIATIVGVIGALAVGIPLRSPLAAVLGGIFFGPLPILFVQFKRKQRLEAMRAQLPDCFDLMGRVMRAGQTMTQAMQSVAEEFAQPIGGEFSYCHEQQNLGLSPDLAFRDLARRTGLIEVKVFVLAMLVQRQTGGNLAELLEKLGTIVRDRYRMRGKVKALTAEGRFQAIILLALPVIVFLALMVINRPYAMQLFDHPSLLMVTVVAMGIGALWIRKIINFDF
ncbi:type II secretion system protein [Roseiconus nitratireducens]|uniref:Type II secretion system protein n=1 Tax=Roseiconus nitratireducens TaxID=2605748 RepID=A0A5M6D358_9BACT|nr:type II secretion system F family protein [Roseiconus nitratireducens]KAA5541336.1 type II secretion system protein [Roseiconus nitratireducens]